MKSQQPVRKECQLDKEITEKRKSVMGTKKCAENSNQTKCDRVS